MTEIIHLKGIPGATVCETSQVPAPTTTILDEVTCWVCIVWTVHSTVRAVA